MTTSNRGPGSRPLSEDEIMEMIFSKWGAQMSVMLTSIVYNLYRIYILIWLVDRFTP